MHRPRVVIGCVVAILVALSSSSPVAASDCRSTPTSATSALTTERSAVDRDCGDTSTTRRFVDAASESDDSAETPRSSRSRIAITLGGLLIAVGLAVQQARSRLQTKDPDTL